MDPFSLSLDSTIKQAVSIEVTFMKHETIKTMITVPILLLQCLANSSHPSYYMSLITITSNPSLFLTVMVPFQSGEDWQEGGEAPRRWCWRPCPARQCCSVGPVQPGERAAEGTPSSSPGTARRGRRRRGWALPSGAWWEGRRQGMG